MSAGNGHWRAIRKGSGLKAGVRAVEPRLNYIFDPSKLAVSSTSFYDRSFYDHDESTNHRTRMEIGTGKDLVTGEGSTLFEREWQNE